MSDAIVHRLEQLRERAALRSMTIHSAPEGWQLASPWRVVVLGDLSAIEAWLTAAESQTAGNTLPGVAVLGVRADG